jgi:hypothetical protein
MTVKLTNERDVTLASWQMGLVDLQMGLAENAWEMHDCGGVAKLRLADDQSVTAHARSDSD